MNGPNGYGIFAGIQLWKMRIDSALQQAEAVPNDSLAVRIFGRLDTTGIIWTVLMTPEAIRSASALQTEGIVLYGPI